MLEAGKVALAAGARPGRSAGVPVADGDELMTDVVARRSLGVGYSVTASAWAPSCCQAARSWRALTGMAARPVSGSLISRLSWS